MKNPELHKITTFDGQEFIVNNNDDKDVISVTPGNWGLPDIDWQTRRAYHQYGDSVVDFNLRPRTLTLEFLSKAHDREDIFARRRALLDFLHPRRGGDLTYTFIREDLTKRAIRGRATGPQFAATPNDLWVEWNIEDPITIECFDPIWFDPNCISADVGNQSSDDELVFPIVFPIVFGAGTVTYGFSIAYDGTWFSYPTISITGPCSSVYMEHVTLDKTITYRRGIPAGQTQTLDLIAQTFINDTDGLDYWPYLSSDSDLDSFRLEHAPEVSGGVNQFLVELDNATANTAFEFKYQNRYIGI